MTQDEAKIPEWTQRAIAQLNDEGRYQVGDKLGDGDFVEVYAAKDLAQGSNVAIKLLARSSYEEAANASSRQSGLQIRVHSQSFG